MLGKTALCGEKPERIRHTQALWTQARLKAEHNLFALL
ncbi:hypothetical protein PORCAN_1089 [Porphyromonas crevioricanis JCM 13913]|nr:hypothetical protein PORCAN_1089 [Porphyromonas crevioricanis JCM 13913]